jgi:protein-S-isoprenylcysteine O-methyltransferase Ste14
MNLRPLVGSGDRIGAAFAPIALVGIVANLVFPAAFEVGGPPSWLLTLSLIVLAVGVVAWAWSVVLIVTRVPAGRLITTGPFRLVRHPLYTSVSLLVLPWLGFLLNTWLGAALGIVLYVASRRFEPAEEAELAERFGPAWDRYRSHVVLPRV